MRILIVVLASWFIGSAYAQPVDKDRVREALAFHGISCDDIRKASKAKRIFWALKYNLSDEQRRQVQITCGLK